MRQYSMTHPEKVAKWIRRWQQKNPDKVREISRRYRARKNDATIGPVDEERIYKLYDYMCIYCGMTDNLSLDHVVSLNNGGAHCEDNLVVACQSCNSSKHVKALEEWLQTQPKARAWVV